MPNMQCRSVNNAWCSVKLFGWHATETSERELCEENKQKRVCMGSMHKHKRRLVWQTRHAQRTFSPIKQTLADARKRGGECGQRCSLLSPRVQGIIYGKLGNLKGMCTCLTNNTARGMHADHLFGPDKCGEFCRQFHRPLQSALLSATVFGCLALLGSSLQQIERKRKKAIKTNVDNANRA